MTDTDKISGKVISIATLQSDNKIEFAFPYNGGGVFATILLRKNQRIGNAAIISVNKGQTICDINEGCDISARFDSGKAVIFHAIVPDDYDSKVLFVSPASKFIKLLKKSKHTVIEVTFYQEGSRQFEFSTTGLNW